MLEEFFQVLRVYRIFTEKTIPILAWVLAMHGGT
jgi:hypothetical protein